MNKIQKISQFMKELLSLNTSKEKKDLYLEYQQVLSSVSAIDVMYLEMYQEENDYTIQDIKKDAGKFVNLFRHSLSYLSPKSYTSKLLTLFIEENQKERIHFETLKKYIHQEMTKEELGFLKAGFEQCVELEKDYLKKENILFPLLEEKIPTKKPLQVLWELHDDARKILKDLLYQLSVKSIDQNDVLKDIIEYYDVFLGIKDKEELILYPLASELFSHEILDSKLHECQTYGFAFLGEIELPTKDTGKTNQVEGVFLSKSGHLNFEQLESMLNYLPFDMTFVDQEDKVAYFNNNPSRHFNRSASIIGRKVEYCHPPKSVHIVKKIILAFKENKKDKAVFRIQMGGKWLLITYFAVRNDKNEYLGTLEVSQDITEILKMEGEIRLLDWDEKMS
ncbi:MAG: PAS domain-containing protein [Candidatus Izemoplasmatales bacterium]